MPDTKAVPSIITELKIATWMEANQAYTSQCQEVVKLQNALKQELRTLQYMKPRLHHTMDLVAKSSPKIVSPEDKVRAIDRYEQEVIHISNTMLENVYEFVEMETKVFRHFDKKRGENFTKGFLTRLMRVVEDAQRGLGQKSGSLEVAEERERDPWVVYEQRAAEGEDMEKDQIFDTVKEVEEDNYAWLDDSLKEVAEDKLADLEREQRAARWEGIVESEQISVNIKEVTEITTSGFHTSEKDDEKFVDRDHTVITVLHITQATSSKPWVSEHHAAEEVKDEIVDLEETDIVVEKDEATITATISAREMECDIYGSEEDRAEKEVEEFSENVDLYSSEDNDFEETLTPGLFC